MSCPFIMTRESVLNLLWNSDESGESLTLTHLPKAQFIYQTVHKIKIEALRFPVSTSKWSK